MDWGVLEHRRLTYSAVGATAGHLPDGYHHIRRRAVIGSGPADFDVAARRLMNWDVQRGAGLWAGASTETVQPGSLVKLKFGALTVYCRVVYVVEESHRRGFAYGTLEGHAESGEELFAVCYDPVTQSVWMEVLAFSRPATWWSRAGRGVAAVVQERITGRYLRALTRPAKH
jgi:uncharacterized protein (UPF0548 family)